MDIKELLGLLAGLLTTAGFVPQVWRLFKLKKADEISLTFTICFVIGIVLWLIYGIALSLLSVILWNAITLVLGILMMYAKLKFGK